MEKRHLLARLGEYRPVVSLRIDVEHLAQRRLRLAPEKKARLVVLLCQYLQTKGGVEDDDIEHTLAVSSL